MAYPKKGKSSKKKIEKKKRIGKQKKKQKIRGADHQNLRGSKSLKKKYNRARRKMKTVGGGEKTQEGITMLKHSTK